MACPRIFMGLALVHFQKFWLLSHMTRWLPYSPNKMCFAAGSTYLNRYFFNLEKFLRSRILFSTGMQDKSCSLCQFWMMKIPQVEKIKPWVGNSNDSNLNVLHLQFLRSLNWGCGNLMLFLDVFLFVKKIEREVLLHRESKKAEQTQLLFSRSKNKSRHFSLTNM